MSQRTHIQWTDRSSNPIKVRRKSDGKQGWHCVMTSPGCAYCYSGVLNGRFGTGLSYTQRDMEQAEFYLDEKELEWLTRIRKPCRVFVCDMTDLFLDAIPDSFIDRLFGVMARTPHVTFQILTKRAERMARYIATPGRQGRINDASIVHDEAYIWERRAGNRADDVDGPEWPLPNVWLGVSVEDQKRADERIPHLLNTPATVRFLSCEPLLAPVDLERVYSNLGGTQHNVGTLQPGRISWVIVGGESGHGARSCDIGWIRSIVRQCKEAGTPCFVKQLGSCPIEGGGHFSASGPDVCVVTQLERPIKLADRKGGNWFEWPSPDLRVREFPQSATASTH